MLSLKEGYEFESIRESVQTQESCWGGQGITAVLLLRHHRQRSLRFPGSVANQGTDAMPSVSGRIFS
jgi:hypothetical protein